MKRILFVILFLSVSDFAFSQAPLVPKYDYMQLSTIESMVAGGLGRSKMLITDKDGNQTDFDMENLFSMGGINFGNIKSNDKVIVLKLKDLTDKGWEVSNVSTGTNDKIFITRYILRKLK